MKTADFEIRTDLALEEREGLYLRSAFCRSDSGLL